MFSLCPSHLSSSILTKVYNWTHGLTHMCCTDLNKWGTSLLGWIWKECHVGCPTNRWQQTAQSSPAGQWFQDYCTSALIVRQEYGWMEKRHLFFLHVCVMSHFIYCLMHLACFPIRVVWRKSHYQVCLMQLPEELTKMTTSLSDCRLQTLWLCRCALMECIWQQLAVSRWPSSQALRSATSYVVPHSAP